MTKKALRNLIEANDCKLTTDAVSRRPFKAQKVVFRSCVLPCKRRNEETRHDEETGDEDWEETRRRETMNSGNAQ